MNQNETQSLKIDNSKPSYQIDSSSFPNQEVIFKVKVNDENQQVINIFLFQNFRPLLNGKTICDVMIPPNLKDWEDQVPNIRNKKAAKRWIAELQSYCLNNMMNQETNSVKSITHSPANSIQHGGNHYKEMAIEPWDYIISNNIGYLEGNAIKYISRWREKGGIEDLKKARHYIDKLIETEEAKLDNTPT